MEQLEEKFLNEIKPLVSEFVEIRKQELDRNKKMRCIDIRNVIRVKTKDFITAYREIINKEIKKNETEVVQMKRQSDEELKKIKDLRDNIIQINKLAEKAKEENKQEDYIKLCNLAITGKQKYEKIRQEYDLKEEQYKSKIEQIDKLKKLQEQFEERYGDIDYIDAEKVYLLDMFIGKMEANKTTRMTIGQIYDENGNPVNNMENIMDMEQEAYETCKQDREEKLKELQKTVSTMFKETQQKLNSLWEEVEKAYAEVDKELSEELKNDEAKIPRNNKNLPKKKKSLWQRFKSIFRKKPLLIEGQEEGEEVEKQEVKPKNKFFEGIRKHVPTLKQQSDNTKVFLDKAEDDKPKEYDEEINEVLALLD